MRDETTWWRLPDPGEPHLLKARFQHRTFGRHSHDRLAIGVIESGGLAFHYRGEEIYAPEGWVNLAFPGEVHTGRPATAEGWTYRMFYLNPTHALEAAQDLDNSCKALPFIPAGAVDDPDLAAQVLRLHRICEDPGSDPLARQSLLGLLIQKLIIRHGIAMSHRNPGKERTAVRKAQCLLEERYDRSVHLRHLAQLTGMNPYRLVRCFTEALGLPPHAYLVQVRVREAARRLREGTSISQAALNVGFADQSHLHRHFVKTFGITPAVYAQAFQTR